MSPKPIEAASQAQPDQLLVDAVSVSPSTLTPAPQDASSGSSTAIGFIAGLGILTTVVLVVVVVLFCRSRRRCTHRRSIAQIMSGRDVAYASALDCVESHAPEERSPQPRSTSKGSLSFWPAPAPAPKSSSSEKKALDSPAHNPLPRQPPGLMQRLKEALFSPHPHRFSPAFGISEIATKLQTQRSSQPQPIPSVLVNLGLPGTDISPHSRPRAAASSLTEADLRNPVLTAIVSRSHLADEKDEISLQMGDTVQVFKLFDDGWCYGARIQAVGQTSTAALIKPGMFPVSCLGQLRP